MAAPSVARNIFLIGPRACGKSSLGRFLLGRLKWKFVDCDEFFRDETGLEIAVYIAKNGWGAFRQLESEFLKRLCHEERQIIATGGGVVLVQENRDLIVNSGWAVYLRGDPRMLAARLTLNPMPAQRPALSGLSLEQEIESVCTEREPLYLSCASLVLQADQPLEILTDKICAALALDG